MRLLTEEMENAFRMDAPLVAEAKAGHSWYDAKYELNGKWRMENGKLMCGAKHRY